MDRFPSDYVLHNLPLLLLSGLDTGNPLEPNLSSKTQTFLFEGGFRIRVDVPIVHGPLAKQLLQTFLDHDASDIPWHSHSSTSGNGIVFRIASVGRVGQTSPRLSVYNTPSVWRTD